MKKSLLLLFFMASTILSKGQSSKVIDSILKIFPAQADTTKAKSLLILVKMYNVKGLPDSALYYANQALDLAKPHGTKKLVCAILYERGYTKSNLAKYEEALEDQFSVLRIADTATCGASIGRANKEIGSTYIFQQKEKEALPYLLNAESVLGKLNDTTGLISVYNNLPVCIALLGDTVKAMQYFNKGFAILNGYASGRSSMLRKEKVIENKMSLTYNMVNFIVDKENLNAAVTEMLGLQNEVESGTNGYQQFILDFMLADLYLRLKEYEKAQAYGEKALKLYKPDGNYATLQDLHWVIARASASMDQYQKAYEHLVSSKENGDSVFKFSKLEAVTAVEAKYQVEKKEQQITTLNNEKKIQRVIVGLTIGILLFVLGLLGFVFRSKKLQKKLFEKEKEIQKKELEQKMAELEQTALRAQMNPHFIFNSLNSVQRFVINNDPEGVNTYLTTFAGLIRQTLENSGKKFIPLKDEIKYLEVYLKLEKMRGNNSFNYHIDIEPGIDTTGTFIPNMIIQPFIENSINHGMTDKKSGEGLISLSFSKSNKLTCNVSDNGNGISNTMLDKIVRDNNHESMGSDITQKRISAYNALEEEKIELDISDLSGTSENSHGTKVTIRFPLKNSA